MVAMTVAVFVVVKVLVWAAAIFDMVAVAEVPVLVIDVLVDVGFIMVCVIVIVLNFSLSASYSVGVSFDVTVCLSMDTLTDILVGVLPAICIEALSVMNANVFTVVKTALEFPVSTPLEEFGRCAAFDWRPLALLDCDRVLQTWMPSYHV